MGIQGLLPLLKSIQKPCNLKQFAGQTLGVDAYGWLHRGTVSCAVELATGKPTSKYIDFCMSRVRMLKHFGVTPYLIFDGDYLPSKSKTEKERSAKRKESRKLGLELLNMGKTSQAYLELQKAVDVTPEMAGALIQELKREGISYVVAPYEADSQMVYLEKQGIIDGILSEDSDLLVFGAKKLLTKLDQYGDVVMIRRDDFTMCREVSFAGWTDREFRQMAIMSGCDYLNSIDKMGLKTAYRLLRKHKTMDRVIRAVQFEGKFGRVPQTYAQDFEQAERTFLYQWVYCPNVKSLVHLTSLPDEITVDDLPFIGKHVDPKAAGGVARGYLHPHTKEPLVLPTAPQKRWMGPPSQNQNRKPAAAETPELKKHKSIDSFFKPARTPLGELDVNLFTGSPHQQEMARRASGSSWPAVSTPTNNGTPGSIIARPSVVPASAPLQARRAFSDHTALRKTTSERAPKRQRLCTEGSSPVSQRTAEKVEYGASKFFGGPTPSKTPSKRGKSSKSEFLIHSDDSLDEVLSQLPMPEGTAPPQKKGKKKIEVFNDDTAEVQEDLQSPREATVDVEVETQVTSVSAVFTQSQQAAGNAPSPPSEADEVDDPPINPFDASLRAEMLNLKSRFAFGASTPSKIPAPAKQTSPKRSTPRGRPAKTGRNLLAQQITEEREARLAQVDGADEPHDDVSETAIGDAEDVVVPGSDAIEPQTLIASPIKGPAAIDTGQPMFAGGSEDLLVSESEVEVSEPPTPKASTFSGDLGRFAFGMA